MGFSVGCFPSGSEGLGGGQRLWDLTPQIVRERGILEYRETARLGRFAIRTSPFPMSLSEAYHIMRSGPLPVSAFALECGHRNMRESVCRYMLSGILNLIFIKLHVLWKTSIHFVCLFIFWRGEQNVF